MSDAEHTEHRLLLQHGELHRSVSNIQLTVTGKLNLKITFCDKITNNGVLVEILIKEIEAKASIYARCDSDTGKLQDVNTQNAT